MCIHPYGVLSLPSPLASSLRIRLMHVRPCMMRICSSGVSTYPAPCNFVAYLYIAHHALSDTHLFGHGIILTPPLASLFHVYVLHFCPDGVSFLPRPLASLLRVCAVCVHPTWYHPYSVPCIFAVFVHCVSRLCPGGISSFPCPLASWFHVYVLHVTCCVKHICLDGCCPYPASLCICCMTCVLSCGRYPAPLRIHHDFVHMQHVFVQAGKIPYLAPLHLRGAFSCCTSRVFLGGVSSLSPFPLRLCCTVLGGTLHVCLCRVSSLPCPLHLCCVFV